MASTPHLQAPTGTTWWATTTLGGVTLALGGLFTALFAWVMFLDPVVGFLTGQETTGLLDSWLTPLVMVVLVDGAAVCGLVARHRGEQGVIAQVLTWLSLGTGVLWTVIVTGTFVGGT